MSFFYCVYLIDLMETITPFCLFSCLLYWTLIVNDRMVTDLQRRTPLMYYFLLCKLSTLYNFLTL